MVVVLTAPIPTRRMPSFPVAASIFGGFFTTGNYIIENFMPLWPFKKLSPESLAVSMAGVKLGDRLLVIGCSDPMLVAQLAGKTGLTGRAVAVDAREAMVATAADVAAREGVLLETITVPWNALPDDRDSFDVVLVRDVLPHLDATKRSWFLGEAYRVLRPGGRCLVIDGTSKKGIFAGSPSEPVASDYAAAGGPVAILMTQGFKAARVLAEREGLLFAEAVKPTN
jgi:ubiquinone/menaquinone biosynthesis C-methylase UbiE